MTSEAAAAGLASMVALLRRICQTPAPTFHEDARAELVTSMFSAAGLAPKRDSAGNVIATVPGGCGSRVLFAAHIDTVFAADTDVTVRADGGRLLAPGVGDNSASLAVMIHVAAQLAGGRVPAPRATLAATVGEEGAGDLYGARHLVAEFGGAAELFVALDGHLGTVVSAGVASRRFEVVLGAKGGHSWGDYPSPSAVHALGDAVAALTRLRVPGTPRSSLNVG